MRWGEVRGHPLSTYICIDEGGNHAKNIWLWKHGEKSYKSNVACMHINEVGWGEVSWGESVSWGQMSWLKWGEVRWGEVTYCQWQLPV